MKRISRIFVTIGLIGSMLLISPSSSHATAAGDAALLAQQIAQFFQDWSFDNVKWSDIDEKLDQVRNLAKTLTNGQQGYSSINNIVKSSKNIISTAKEFERYLNYLENFGDNFRIDRAYTIYKSFCRRSDNLYNDITKTLKSFDSLEDLNSLDYIKTLEEVTSELSDNISSMSETSKADIVDLCQEVAIDQSVEENQKFLKLNIGS